MVRSSGYGFSVSKSGLSTLALSLPHCLVLGWVGIAFSVADGLLLVILGVSSDDHARVGMVWCSGVDFPPELIFARDSFVFESPPCRRLAI